MSAARTPTPWRPGKGDTLIAAGHDRSVVALEDDGACGDPECCGSPTYRIECSAADLAFILNASNSHDALVAALERALKWRSCAGAYANGDHKTLAEMRADFEAGEAALKAAKGEA